MSSLNPPVEPATVMAPVVNPAITPPPAQLRHLLRTPLNHVIGYSEMMIEDLAEQEAAENAQAIRECLDSLIFNARELVKFIQNSLTADKVEVGATDLRDLQFWLKGHVKQLLADTDALSILVSGTQVEDVNRIRFAAERLLGFAEGRIGALAEPQQQETPGSPPRAAGHEPHLLVVDDNSGNRDILSRHLERQGYQVSLSSNGVQALELIETNQFDLVLLDVIMPGMDGFTILQRMKASPALNATPVIMISALDESQSVIRCIQMGAEDYLMKPFDPVLLSARIDASLEKKRLRDEERKRTAELEQALGDLRHTQDQLLVQEKLASLGALTAGIAHEIKNPLNFVTNFASLSTDLLKQLEEAVRKCGPANPEVGELLQDLRQNIAKIEEHGKRADRIVRGMLMHSRGGSGQSEPADVNALLTDSMNLAYHGLRAQDSGFNVRIEADLDPALAPVNAVPQDLSRVFINIINNACYAAYDRKKREGKDFMPHVQIRSRETGTAAEVKVRDNGSGIPAEVREKIFHPFFTTKPAGIGTGLGLSISYEIIVRGHQGQLSVDSLPGAFTEFTVLLPRSTDGV